MTENEISYEIRGAIFDVSNNLGPGLLESAYEAALGFELGRRGLFYTKQVPLAMQYETIYLDVAYRLDFLVENKVIIELKSVETLMNVHHKQIITYLKLSDLKLAFL